MFNDLYFELPYKDSKFAKFKIGQLVKLNLSEEKANRLGAPHSGVICGLQVQSEDEIEYQIRGFGPLVWEHELEEYK